MTVTANDIPLDECVQWKVSPLNVSSESNKLEKREICHLSFRWRNVNFASKIYGSHPAGERERSWKSNQRVDMCATGAYQSGKMNMESHLKCAQNAIQIVLYF